MKQSLCAMCGGSLHAQKVPIDRLISGRLYLFEHVAVQLCGQCGEMWIPGTEAERMEQAIQGKLKPKRKVAVPVF